MKHLRIETIKLSLLGMLCIVLYAPTFSMFLYDWRHDDNYSHGFLVPFIVGYIVWTKWDTLRKLVPQPSVWGLVMLIFGLFIYLAGTIGAEWFLRRSSLIVVVGGLIWYLYGRSCFTTLLFPLVFLIFAIPLPAIIYKSFAFQLQLLVAKVSAGLMTFFGYSVYRSGNILEIRHGPLEVAEACSGMRSIMALLALSSLFAYITGGSRRRQWFLTACALPVAVVTNIVRITSTGIVGHYWGLDAAGNFEQWAGFAVLVVALLLLCLISALLSRISVST